MAYLYPTLQQTLDIHSKILEISGGRYGQEDAQNLTCTLAMIANNNYYPTFLDKLTHLAYEVNKKHAFVDGNKRTSIALSELFLKLNGYHYILPGFAGFMKFIAIGVAANIIEKQELKLILECLLEGTIMVESSKVLVVKSTRLYYSEELKNYVN